MEPFTVLATANAAYKTLKTALSHGREVSDYASVLVKFWDAKEELSEIEQKNKHPNMIEKTFGAKSVESQALQIILHKKKIMTLEKDLHDLFVWSGNGDLWSDMMKERRSIRQRRYKESIEKAKRKQFYVDVVLSLIVGLFFGVLVFVIIYFILNA